MGISNEMRHILTKGHSTGLYEGGKEETPWCNQLLGILHTVPIHTVHSFYMGWMAVIEKTATVMSILCIGTENAEPHVSRDNKDTRINS